MIKCKFYRFIALTLVFAITTTLLCSCNQTTTQNITKNIEYIVAKTENDIVYNSSGNFSVTVTADEPVFSDYISEAEIKIHYSVINEKLLPDIYSENGIALYNDEYKDVIIEPNRIVRHSERSVTVDFTDKNFKNYTPDFYLITFNDKINGEEKNTICSVSLRRPHFSLVSDISSIPYESGEVKLKLTIDQSTFNPDISADDIVFSGGFKGAKINSVTLSSENTISLDFAFSRYKELANGEITIKNSAINGASYDSTVRIKLLSPSVVCDYNSFEASQSFARISISLIDCSFSDNVSSLAFSTSNENIKVNRFDKMSDSEGVIYLTYEMESVEEAVEALGLCGFTIDQNALNISKNVVFNFIPRSPSVYARIISLEEDNSDFVVLAAIEVTGGTFGYLSTSKISFGGDYSKAQIIEIDNNDSSAKIKFKIPKTSSVDNADLYGTIALKSDTVISKWGSKKSVPAFPLSFKSVDENKKLDYSILGNESETPSEKLLIHLLEGYKDNGNVLLLDDNIDKTYLSVISNNSCLTKLEEFIKDKIYNPILPSNNALIDSQRYAVNLFLSDISTLRAALVPMLPYLSEIYELTKKMKNASEDEIEELKIQYNSSVNSLRALIDTKIKGMTFEQLFNTAVSDYIGQSGIDSALECFDGICDRLTNWESLSVDSKKCIRYYANSIFAQCFSAISFIELKDDDPENLHSNFFSMLCYYSDEQKLTENSAHSDKCNTIGREVTFNRITGNRVNTSGELSTSEISQLQNLTGDTKTLLQELNETNFDVDHVRYILCSDTSDNHSIIFSDTDNGIKCTVSSKVTVFDLVQNKIINDLEYERYCIIVSDTDKHNVTVYKHLPIYSTK